jgi:hypothetical protein
VICMGLFSLETQFKSASHDGSTPDFESYSKYQATVRSLIAQQSKNLGNGMKSMRSHRKRCSKVTVLHGNGRCTSALARWRMWLIFLFERLLNERRCLGVRVVEE